MDRLMMIANYNNYASVVSGHDIFLWNDMSYRRTFLSCKTFLVGGHALRYDMSYWNTCLMVGYVLQENIFMEV